MMVRIPCCTLSSCRRVIIRTSALQQSPRSCRIFTCQSASLLRNRTPFTKTSGGWTSVSWLLNDTATSNSLNPLVSWTPRVWGIGIPQSMESSQSRKFSCAPSGSSQEAEELVCWTGLRLAAQVSSPDVAGHTTK